MRTLEALYMAHIWFFYWNPLKISFRWCSLLNWNCISGSDWTLFPDQLFAAKFDAWDINQDGVIDSEEVVSMSKKMFNIFQTTKASLNIAN